MVAIPQLEVLDSTAPAVVVREVKETLPLLGQVLERLDQMKPEDIAEIYVWLAEHPSLPGINPVRLAVASFDSLKEEELPEFFDRMKDSMQYDMWQVLTED